MSLNINSNYPQPSFGSVKLLSKATELAKNSKAGKFAQDQAFHAFTQVSVIGAMEAISPSTNLESFIAKKLYTDFAEAFGTIVGAHLSPKACYLTAKTHCTNIFAYMSDLIRAEAKASLNTPEAKKGARDLEARAAIIKEIQQAKKTKSK